MPHGVTPMILYTNFTRGGQKFLSLDIFAYVFRTKKFTGFSNRLLLVLLKNYMSSACLLYQIQCIENSWLHSTTDFNKIRYRPVTPVTEFLALKNVQPLHIHKRGCCIRSRYAIISHGDSLCCWVTSKQKKPSRRAPVGTPMRSCLWRKLSCCWKYCIAESSLPHLEVMRGFQSLGVTVLVCLSVYQSAVLQKKL